MIFVVLRCKGTAFFAHVQIYLKIIKENVAVLQENREENRPKTLLKEKNIENTLE
jgi:hypothetical protein